MRACCIHVRIRVGVALFMLLPVVLCRTHVAEMTGATASPRCSRRQKRMKLKELGVGLLWRVTPTPSPSPEASVLASPARCAPAAAAAPCPLSQLSHALACAVCRCSQHARLPTTGARVLVSPRAFGGRLLQAGAGGQFFLADCTLRTSAPLNVWR